MKQVEVLNQPVGFYQVSEEDYLSLTDIARYKNPDHTDDLIRNWVRNRNTIEFLGIWEHLNNPEFNPVEFDGIRNQAGRYGLSQTKRLERLNQIAIQQMTLLATDDRTSTLHKKTGKA